MAVRSAIAAGVSVFLLTAFSVGAEEPASPALTIELNALQQVETICRIVFVAENTTTTDISEMAVETVLFNRSGKVERFALFNFRALPAQKMRVRQFDLADADCGALGRILINGTTVCKVGDADDSVCTDRLRVKGTAGVELIG